jgi:class 3 adenylate cyclase
MIDHPDRETPRFPESIADDIKERLRRTIIENDIHIGFCSIACGADILFIEAMLELKREVRLYLPFNEHDFRNTSIRIGNSNWEERFDQIITHYPLQVVTEERYLQTADLFHFLGKVIMGQAMLHADIFDTEPYLLSVLSESQSRKTGGTQDLVDMWPNKSRWINLKPLPEPLPEQDSRQGRSHPSPDTEIKREIRYILFSDIVGFSKLDEDETPQFIHKVLSSISELSNKQEFNPDVINTWGDAIFIGHSNATELVEFAFALLQLFETTDWGNMGFPEATNIRIALHAGPVFTTTDPLTKRPNLYGSHINKAARMEPVTIPGTVFVSDQFASCLRIESGNQYEYEHVGIIELPKKFGRQEIYRLGIRKA